VVEAQCIFVVIGTSDVLWSYGSISPVKRLGAAPPSFRPSDPALCGSCPLVTPYYCRLGDLLCYNCMLYLSTILCVWLRVLDKAEYSAFESTLNFPIVSYRMCNLCFLCCFPLQLSPSVLWYCWLGPLTCKNRLPYNLYCVGGDVKHCSINQSTGATVVQKPQTFGLASLCLLKLALATSQNCQ